LGSWFVVGDWFGFNHGAIVRSFSFRGKWIIGRIGRFWNGIVGRRRCVWRGFFLGSGFWGFSGWIGVVGLVWVRLDVIGRLLGWSGVGRFR
jgi:hypothetical protein